VYPGIHKTRERDVGIIEECSSLPFQKDRPAAEFGHIGNTLRGRGIKRGLRISSNKEEEGVAWVRGNRGELSEGGGPGGG